MMDAGNPSKLAGTNTSMAPMVTTEQPMVVMTTEEPMTWDDATWILTSSFIIFTMQSGKHSPLKTKS